MKFVFGIIVVAALGYFVVSRVDLSNFDTENYQTSLEQIQANDFLAVQLFNLDEEAPPEEYAKIAEGGAEKYEENLDLIEKGLRITGIPDDKYQELKDIQEYTRLRLKMFNLLQKGAEENSDQYQNDIQSTALEIEALQIYQNVPTIQQQ